MEAPPPEPDEKPEKMTPITLNEIFMTNLNFYDALTPEYGNADLKKAKMGPQDTNEDGEVEGVQEIELDEANLFNKQCLLPLNSKDAKEVIKAIQNNKDPA